MNKENISNKFQNFKITNNSKDFSNSKKSSNRNNNKSNYEFSPIIIRNKNLSNHKINKYINRYFLYTQKFFKKSFSFKKDKEKEINEDLLPNIKQNMSKFSYIRKNKFNLNLNNDIIKNRNNLMKSQYNLSNNNNFYKVDNNFNFSNGQSNLVKFKKIFDNLKPLNPEININEDNKLKILYSLRNKRKLYKSRSQINIKSKSNL